MNTRNLVPPLSQNCVRFGFIEDHRMWEQHRMIAGENAVPSRQYLIRQSLAIPLRVSRKPKWTVGF